MRGALARMGLLLGRKPDDFIVKIYKNEGILGILYTFLVHKICIIVISTHFFLQKK